MTPPPLPTIRDAALLRQVFTHRSLHARPTHMFEDPPDDPSPDNEMCVVLSQEPRCSVSRLVLTLILRFGFARAAWSGWSIWATRC